MEQIWGWFRRFFAVNQPVSGWWQLIFFFTPNLGKNDPIWLLTTLLGTNISLGPKAFLSRWFSQLPQVGPMWSFPRWDNIFQLGWFNHHLDMKPWINIVPDGALEPLLPDHSFQPFTPRQNSFNRLLASQGKWWLGLRGWSSWGNSSEQWPCEPGCLGY